VQDRLTTLVAAALLVFSLPSIAQETPKVNDQGWFDEIRVHKNLDALTSRDIPGLETKAEKGDAEAQLYLGLVYFNGKIAPQSIPKSVEWLQKSADQGNVQAAKSLAESYDTGYKGAVKDDTIAVKWYRFAAERDNPHAQLYLSDLYAHGRGLDPNPAKALAWIQGAAAKGDPVAVFTLSALYVAKNKLGVKQDVPQAVALLHKAADLGVVPALNFIGRAYSEGKGVPKDKTQAVTWYLKAANLGDADAQYNLAYMYEHGDGVAKDRESACKWYMLAQQGGNLDAGKLDARTGTPIFYRRFTADEIARADIRKQEWNQKHGIT
jgi:uncharacterized protein